MNDYDQAARFAIKMDPPGFFRWVWPRLDPALVFRGWRDTRTLPFPGEPDRTCDTVAEFGHTNNPQQSLIVVVEAQSRPDRDMLFRFLEYLARVLRELNLAPEDVSAHPVVGVLLNLTGPPQTATLEVQLPGHPDVGLWLGIELRTMRNQDAAATLAAIAAGDVAFCILPWIPLMRGAAESSIIERWKEIASQESDDQRRSAYGGVALVFADLAGCEDQWQRGLENWTMNESKIVARWRAEARAEGTLDTRREDLLQVLRLRFPTALPADLLAAVQAINDPEELSRWLAAAATAPSLDAFRNAVYLEPVRA